LSALVGSTSFVESFVAETLHKDLVTIFNFIMIANPQATFVMFLLCYTQRLGYLLCTMFPSLGIL
jgi:hypothetical protein